jgi:hypothetical protein
MCRKALIGERCLGRLREEKALMWPMMVSAIEKHFIGYGEGQRLHVFAYAREQGQSSAQQLLSQLLADIALVAKEFANKALCQRWDGFDVRYIAGGQPERDDLVEFVEHQMKFKPKEPAHRGLAAFGQSGECFVPPDAPVVADRERRGIDVVNPG